MLRTLATQGKLAQLAETVLTIPDADVWMEPKFDGWRILAFVEEDRVDFFARSGKTYNGKLPHVEAELLANCPPGTVIDGEAVALRIDGDKVINEWGTTQSILTKGFVTAAASKITFMAFDLIAHGGIDARSLRQDQRRELLERVFESGEFEACQITTIMEATDENHACLVAQGFEGSMIKRLDAPYQSGKRAWMRMKATATVDAVVIGFKPGQGGFTGLVGAVVFGQFDPVTKCMVERGRCSGMDMKTRQDMSDHPEKWMGKVIEIRHMGVSIGNTDSGRFRHPQFRRIRSDRDPGTVLLHDA